MKDWIIFGLLDLEPIKSKVIKESIFDELTTIIQETTKRYTTFHSLRHGYASYETLRILNDTDVNIYSFIDLSTMGHESPEITLKVYVHAALILLNLQQQGKNK